VGGAALIALLALKGVAWIGAAPPSPLLSFVTADEVLLFFMGMTAARIVDRIPLSPFPCWLLLTIGAGIIATPFVAAGHAEAALNRTLLCGMGSSMLIMGLVSLERSGAVRFSNGPLRLLGDGSYALYLIHYPLISLVVKMLVAIGMGGSGLIGLALSATIAVASSVLCSILLHRRFERPLMSALGRRLGVKRSVQNRLPA
jgi:peptidoglycan/LPS O-acetylase OafA/YrhL